MNSIETYQYITMDGMCIARDRLRRLNPFIGDTLIMLRRHFHTPLGEWAEPCEPRIAKRLHKWDAGYWPAVVAADGSQTSYVNEEIMDLILEDCYHEHKVRLP